MVKYEVMKDALSRDKSIARRNRERFKDNDIIAINIMGSPGSGKTTLIKEILHRINKNYNCGVVEADLATTIDAEKLEDLAFDIFQINTAGVCHLTAQMLERAINRMNLSDMDILFIENVGNLVCPSAFDLGEILRVGLVSTPEGDDKPAKYPSLFHGLDAVVITKVDLIELTDFNLKRVFEDIKKIKSDIKTFSVSAKKEEGLEEFIEWIVNH